MSFKGILRNVEGICCVPPRAALERLGVHIVLGHVWGEDEGEGEDEG